MIRLSRFKEFAVFYLCIAYEVYLKNEDDNKTVADKDVIAIQTRWRQIGLSALVPSMYTAFHISLSNLLTSKQLVHLMNSSRKSSVPKQRINFKNYLFILLCQLCDILYV